MRIQRQIEYRAEKEGTEQEGIVVWDQKGLVVRWPDGHCSRFLWAMLRHSCPCPKCCKQREDEEGTPLDFPGGVARPREAREAVLLP
jgi:hypothetical protein